MTCLNPSNSVNIKKQGIVKKVNKIEKTQRK